MQNNTQPVSVSPLKIAYALKPVGASSPAQTVVLTNDKKTGLGITKIVLEEKSSFILQTRIRLLSLMRKR
jgi:hypothetical protein